MSMLNARAITSPIAMTITSPRIRKFLKPLIAKSPLRVAAIHVRYGSWLSLLYQGYLLPLLSVTSNHVNDPRRTAWRARGEATRVGPAADQGTDPVNSR